MSKTLQAIRGMNDILPSDISAWQAIETQLKSIVSRYGYREIRFPIVESTALFKRSIGEVTDIVEKEMYTFSDRNGDSVTLRPEGTAGCARAVLQHGLLHQQTQRLWYTGPMFRYERPQRGRYRQFFHFGVETFGVETPDIDAEIIALSAQCWKALGFSEQVRLEINSLGSQAAREAYRQVLVAYFEAHIDQLDEDSKRRLHSNPLRILDSKNPDMQACNANAPKMIDHLDPESAEHFSQLCAYLDAAGIEYQINPRLVRGLDYYNRTVFEWVTDSLGAQGTVCAGGRYDGLVEQLGGKPAPAVGFAMGIERLLALYQTVHEPTANTVDLYIIKVGDRAQQAGFALAEEIRQAIPQLQILNHCGGGSFKSQFKKADKSGATMALILGDDEIEQNLVGIKYLRSDQEQQSISQSDIVNFLQNQLTEARE